MKPIQHLLIRASAGSGKTYQLSSRYLALIRRGNKPSQVLATTFTRKAAGEVLARVVSRLNRSITDDNERASLSNYIGGKALTPDDCMKMLRELTGSMHRLSVSTIDGFFNRIARCFAHELDLPPEPVLVDESHPRVAQLRLDAIEAMLGDADVGELVLLLRQFHHDHAARSVTRALDDIIMETYEAYREAPEQQKWDRLDPQGFMDQDELRRAIQRLADAAGLLPSHKKWREAYEDHLHTALGNDWENFIAKGLTKKLCAGEETFHSKPIEGELRAALETLITHAKAFLVKRVATQTRATHDILRRFDAHYTELRGRQGLLLFSDLTHKLARQLPGMGDGLTDDIYFRLDGEVSHLLLDEFQDTSLSQWDVLSPIAQEITDSSQGDERSVFIVGDTKQAIYGWRGGVAELFDKVAEDLRFGDENIDSLNSSYRSSQVVLGAVNEVFEQLGSLTTLDRDTETAAHWQAGFTTHVAERDLPGHVTLETSTAGANVDDDADDNDAEVGDPTVHAAHDVYVANRVKELYERSGGSGSIGVLVSTNIAASRLIHEIGRLGLPVSGEGGGWLTDSPAVSALLSALVMADHPGDTASTFHVLNSPLAKVVGLRSIDDSKGHVRDVALSIRKTLLARGYAQTLADWTRAVSPSCDPRGLTRLTQLITLADQFDEGDSLRPTRFVALAESQRVAEPSPAAIRVMTVHGSKGLEFDTVVMAELDKTFRDRTPLLIERRTPTTPITGVYRYASKDIRALDAQLEHAYALHRRSRLMDWLCALYVGMTRARQALHMVIKPRKLTDKGKISTRGLSFAAILVEALAQEEDSLDGGQVLYAKGDPGWVCTANKPQALPTAEVGAQEPIELAAGSDNTRRFLPTVAPSSRAGGDRSAASLLDISTESAEAKRYGTLIHGWMERVGLLGEDALPDEAELRKIATEQMPTMTGGRLDERLAWFYRLLKNPNATRLLSRNGAAELWRERRFVIQDGRELMRGCFDRVLIYRDADGRVTAAELLDFKTDHIDPSDPTGTAPHAEHYLPQMRAYQRALAQILKTGPEAVRMRLWFVGPDEVVDLTD